MKYLTNKLAQFKQWILSIVTYRFSLKSGEKVWVCVRNERWGIKQATIKGFYAYGIAYKDHPYLNWNHYCNGLFYGFGYHNDGYVMVITPKSNAYLHVSKKELRREAEEGKISYYITDKIFRSVRDVMVIT